MSEPHNETSLETASAGVDPRCPHCDRPVIGDGVAGLEGVYHWRCTQPPQEVETGVGSIWRRERDEPLPRPRVIYNAISPNTCSD